MYLEPFFKSVLEQDRSPIVICDLNHVIVYMNPAAVRHYRERGSVGNLVGRDVRLCHPGYASAHLEEICAWFARSVDNNIVFTRHNEQANKDDYMVALRDDDGTLIGYYGKHEFRDLETGPTYQMD